MRKKRKLLFHTISRCSIGYLLIVTIAAAFFIYAMTVYSHILNQEVAHTNTAVLKTVQMKMDQKIKSLQTVFGRAALSPAVRRLGGISSYTEVSPYELYQTVQEFSDHMVPDDIRGSCYLYFPHSDVMISSASYRNSKDFYDITLRHDYSFDYKAWYGIISRRYEKPQIFMLENKNASKELILLAPVKGRNNQQGEVNVIMIVDYNKLLTECGVPNTANTICIVDRRDKKILSDQTVDKKAEQYLLKSPWRKRQGNERFGSGSPYALATYVKSGHEDWEYVVLADKQQSITRVEGIKNSIVVLLVVYLLCSIAILLYIRSASMRPLKKIADILSSHSGKSTAGINTCEFIDRSLCELVDSNKRYNDVIDKQRDAIQKELLRRLLTTPKEGELPCEELLETYDIHIKNRSILIFACEMDDVDTAYGEAKRIGAMCPDYDVRFVLRNITEELLGRQKIVCMHLDINEQLVFITVSTSDEQLFKKQVEDTVAHARAFILEHFDFSYHVAIGGIRYKKTALYNEYLQIKKIFAYQRHTKGHSICCCGDVNLLPEETMLTYSLETEQKLFNCIRAGNADQAYQMVRHILDENQIYCMSPEIMEFLTSNICNTMLRACEKAKDGRRGELSVKKLIAACNEGDRECVDSELKKIIETICSQISEYELQKKKDQKSELCREIKQYIEAHYGDVELSVNAAAEHFHVQSAYLSKVFKNMECKNLSQYINDIRLMHAKEELACADMGLERIAAQCGYGSQRTFLRIFKSYLGITPSQFRQMEIKRREEIS